MTTWQINKSIKRSPLCAPATLCHGRRWAGKAYPRCSDNHYANIAPKSYDNTKRPPFDTLVHHPTRKEVDDVTEACSKRIGELWLFGNLCRRHRLPGAQGPIQGIENAHMMAYRPARVSDQNG